MEPFKTLTGIAVPLLEDDINTDQISPVMPGRALKPDYAALLFARARARDDGSENPDFILNKPQFRKPSILVSGRNFGCGSSREASAWALLAFGIRCVIARSIADFFRENCLQNGMLPIALPEAAADDLERRVLASDGRDPFTVDLERQIIAGPGGGEIGFELPPADRTRLLEGLDDIGMSLKHASEIAAWEARTAASVPWLQIARDRRIA